MTALIALLAALGAGAPSDTLTGALNHLAAEVHRGYERQGLVWSHTPPYLAELFATVAGLYPETALELYLLRLADGNASALPDGRVYLRQGFLAQIDAAEEVIFVLAHEAAHVALKHVAERCRDDPRRELYSVEVEIEADREALERMRAAGIETAGVGAFLSRLAGDDNPESDVAVRVARIGTEPGPGPRPLPAPLVALHDQSVALLMELDRHAAVRAYLAARGDALEPARSLAIQGELVRREQRWETAEALFRQAIGADPDSAAAWRGLALTLEAGHRLDAAREAWRRVLTLDPDPPDASLIRAFLSEECAFLHDADPPGHGQPARFGEWQVRLPDPWRIARAEPDGFTASPDSIDLTRLRIEAAGPPRACRLSPLLLDQVLRRQRARPGAAALVVESVVATDLGALARLNYRDELGVAWRLDLYAISGPAGHFGAAYRAPARHYHSRWAADARAIIASIGTHSPEAAGGRGTR